MNPLMLKLTSKQGNPIQKEQRASRNAHALIQNDRREDFPFARLVFICVVHMSHLCQTAFVLLINSHFGYFSMNSWRNNGGYFAVIHHIWNDLFYFWKNYIEPWVIWNCRVQINNQITKESWEFHLVTKRAAHAHNEWMTYDIQYLLR